MICCPHRHYLADLSPSNISTSPIMWEKSVGQRTLRTGVNHISTCQCMLSCCPAILTFDNNNKMNQGQRCVYCLPFFSIYIFHCCHGNHCLSDCLCLMWTIMWVVVMDKLSHNPHHAVRLSSHHLIYMVKIELFKNKNLKKISFKIKGK